MENTEALVKYLYSMDYHPQKLRDELASGKYSAEEINIAAIDFVEQCWFDMYSDGWSKRIPHAPGEIVEGVPAGHLYEAVEVLLEYGLDPNFISDDGENLMDTLRGVDNGYVAADTLLLLLERGGNPDIWLDGENLLDSAFFDLGFDLYNQEDRLRYDAFVHYWMVLAAYANILNCHEKMVDPVGKFDPANLRNHRNYYYGEIRSDRSNDGMEICFFDKETNLEVARY